MRLSALLGVPILLLSSPAFAAPCDHAFFPLKEGMNWTWSTPPRTVALRVTKVVKGMATLATDNPAGKDQPPLTVEVACSADGVDFDLSRVVSLMLGAGGIQLHPIKHTGTAFPTSARFKTGESWESSHTMEMLSDGKVVATMESKSTGKVLGAEKVKVQAGEFEAVKIQMETDTSATRAGAEGGSTPALHSTQTLWVAKGVGLVKQSTVLQGKPDPTVTELVSYSH